MLSTMNPGETRSAIFRQLQLVKRIEGHFKKESVLCFIDEDCNFDVAFEYNFATGNFRTVNPIRFDVSERLVRTIHDKHPDLWKMIVDNNLRAIMDVAVEFKEVARNIFRDMEFWVSAGWDPAVWSRIDEEEFIDFVLGKREELPANMPEWNSKLDLWKLIVSNNFSASGEISLINRRKMVREMFQDPNFRACFKWDPAVWSRIDEKEFIDFVLGQRKKLPANMPEWNKTLPDQTEKAYVGALKTFLSKTIESVRSVNPKLERGVASINGVTVVPFSDGAEKQGVLYGEESENILHHIFHYGAAGNTLGEEIFTQKFKDLGGLEARISPQYPETWRMWANAIARVYSEKGYDTMHQAFVQAPELALERIQFLRHLMLETDFMRVYHKQITFNSQDMGIGVDVRIGSGTGKPFALNLSDYMEDSVKDPDVVIGETLLCLQLNRKTTTFKGTPLEHVEQKALDPDCQAILIYDQQVLGNDSEKLAAHLRQRCDRQMIYRAQEEQQLVKKIWNAGEHFFPMGYEPEAIDPATAFFIFGRGDCRGVDMRIPLSGHKYCEAMVGIGNQEDPIAQLVWRARHIDMGHDIQMSHDEKTELQIRTALGLDKDTPVKIGHAMRYFSINTLEEEAVNNVKATLFKAQTPIKTFIDAEVRKEYDMTGIHNATCLEELEGRVVYGAVQDLYILSNNTRWVREYEAHKTVNPCQFVEGLCRDELKKIEAMEKHFIELFINICHSNPDARILINTISRIDAQIASEVTLNVFEGSLQMLLMSLSFTPTYSAEQFAIGREMARKYFAIRRGFAMATCEVQAQLALLKKEEYQKHLKNYLPPAISVDLDQGARSEQKIQQLQEQKPEQRQQKIERVLTIGHGDAPTLPINFRYFKSVAMGEARIHRRKKYEWHDNGNFLPLGIAVQQELLINLPKNEYQNTYISQRAWALLNKMGRSGAPTVEILVINIGNKCHTVIITPAEREETVSKAFIEERATLSAKVRKSTAADPDGMAVFALSNEYFSRMVLDAVKDVREDQYDFVHKMVMNKLFLNWTQFSLDEFEYLVMYVLELEEKAVEGLSNDLVSVHGNGSRTSTLLTQIRQKEPEWVAALAKRKLEENYSYYRPEETESIRQWVNSLLSNAYLIEIGRLRRMGANHSVRLLERLRDGGASSVSLISTTTTDTTTKGKAKDT